jgi:hypothetical protein
VAGAGAGALLLQVVAGVGANTLLLQAVTGVGPRTLLQVAARVGACPLLLDGVGHGGGGDGHQVDLGVEVSIHGGLAAWRPGAAVGFMSRTATEDKFSKSNGDLSGEGHFDQLRCQKLFRK